ncbi:MAG TPA: HAD family hydrolase [Chloroflexota bacterium]|nr:HAD family hydrolase [Chloroflexota bacterium]
MATLPLDLVVFDIMGTLVKDIGAMENALKGALSHHSIPFALADLMAMRGAGKIAGFTNLIERTIGQGHEPEWSRAKATEVYTTFKRLLREGYAKGPAQEIPGAEATMRWLKSRGIMIAATSAVDIDLLQPLMDRLGWADGMFDCMVTTEEVPMGRPAPYMIFVAMMRTGILDVHRVAAVGDTSVDLKAGTNAGAGWVVGVLSGAHDLDRLGAVPHTHIINSVAELPKIFESRPA